MTTMNTRRALPPCKTKIVCTIGPASRSPEVLRRLVEAGMSIARLNFSHGDYAGHGQDIRAIRQVSVELDRPVAIVADLPGPKIRIGELDTELLHLENGQSFILTTEKLIGNREIVSVTLANLPEVVHRGDAIYLNDGFIQLKVEQVSGRQVHCRVVVGGPLRSRKGLNVPNVDLGVTAFTAEDREIVDFALGEGVDGVCQSFVERADDVQQLRDYAAASGYSPFIIAKIERAGAVRDLESILAVADGIMVARGDLGVEIPIARVPVVQKEIMYMANRVGKPVITATHMLESMITNRLPTRAEATDVANAIIDGTDCVMLSGESAIGEYPEEAVHTLTAIATEVEKACLDYREERLRPRGEGREDNLLEVIAASVAKVIHQIRPAAVIVPTRSGATARNITRYRLPVWIFGVSSQLTTCRELLFSYGVIVVHEPDHPTRWRPWIRDRLGEYGVDCRWAVLTEGPSSKYPDRNDRMEIIDLTRE